MNKQQRQIYYWAHMLDEAFEKSRLLNEGKHWPEDYIKTGINMVKSSQLGQQPWYSDAYIQQDIQTFADEFQPLSHNNANLGFFSVIVHWFIEYSGVSKEKYQDFINRKMNKIIAALLKISTGRAYDSNVQAIKVLRNVKSMSFEQFEKIADDVNAKTSDITIAPSNAKYNVVPIYSYEQMHQKYGGDKTGWHGQSEWCHANGESTYESWTKDGTQAFFVIEQEDWQNIEAPDHKPDNCYDAYGMSLIAVLVDVDSNKLLNSTSRWNHVVLPNSGAADTMFENWKQLNDAVSMDVENECRIKAEEFKKKIQRADEEVEKLLADVDVIDENTIPKEYKNKITSINIPNSVKSIEDYAFFNCTSLESINIPDSVKSIGEYTFLSCKSLKSITIPDSVESIGYRAFTGCESLESIIISNLVESIGDYVFSYCKSLKNINIPNQVKSIGENAFDNCWSLKSITIPGSVESIGDWAFTNCVSLEEVIFKRKTFEEVKSMNGYPWGIEDESIIRCEA